MLAELVRKAEMKKANITDPFEAHRKRPLADHLGEWEPALKAEDNTPRHVRQTVSAVRRALQGCRFVFLADVQASRVQEYLAGLRRPGRVVPPLATDKQQFTKAEVAAALGIKPRCVTSLVQRHGLAATGNGKARRFPVETVEFLLARLSGAVWTGRRQPAVLADRPCDRGRGAGRDRDQR